jgi:putative phage-type endonuclease
MKKNLNRQKHIKRKSNKRIKNIMTEPKEVLKELLEKPLIKQRTPEWFKLRENRLTASDLYDAIKNPLSLSKKKLKGITYNSNAIPALKWGTMFEAVAIDIYEDLKKKKIYEFGLVINDDIKNFGASPDGITEDGRMIEIKCPYKRKIIDGEIPEKYQYQIQGQLAVCKLNDCDYIECEFVCYDTKEDYERECKSAEYYGIIAELKKEKGEIEYKYSKINESFNEELNGYKFIYWKLNLINIQEVKFNKEKWDNEILPKINEFHVIYMNEKNNNNNLFINDD